MLPYPVRNLCIARMIISLLLLSTMLLLSACGDASQERQPQARFDQQLQHAEQIGVPALLLEPLTQAEQQMQHASPFSFLNNESVNTHEHSLLTHYALLTAKLQAVIANTTHQTRSQAQQDLSNFYTTLQQHQSLHQPTGNFSSQLTQLQFDFAKARYPRDYRTISDQTHDDIQALALLADIPRLLTTLQKAIEQANDLHLEAHPLMNSYQQDSQTLGQIATLLEAQRLQQTVSAQYQQTLATLAVSFPQIIMHHLKTLAKQIQTLHEKLQDTTKYQQDLKRYSQAARRSMSLASYQDLTRHLDEDITQSQMTLLRVSAHELLQQLTSEAQAWGNAHLYHDSYNGQNYPLDAGYLSDGIGSDLQDTLSNASNIQDLEQVINQANNVLFNLHIMQNDAKDHTNYDQVHATDLQLLSHYQLTGQVMLVSLTGQALRLYQDGQFVRAFLITSGRAERPSLPGLWSVQERLSPTIFKSGDPPGSPYWYPDTPINYAMLYHDGGYFLHDSWWRNNYGPGTQFPHADSSGDQQFAGNGSHGCINLSESQAAWLYQHTAWNTAVVVY